VENKSKKQRDFNPITVDINFTINIKKFLWAEKVWRGGGPHRKFDWGPMKFMGGLAVTNDFYTRTELQALNTVALELTQIFTVTSVGKSYGSTPKHGNMYKRGMEKKLQKVYTSPCSCSSHFPQVKQSLTIYVTGD
jgi:hypothetical protein